MSIVSAPLTVTQPCLYRASASFILRYSILTMKVTFSFTVHSQLFHPLQINCYFYLLLPSFLLCTLFTPLYIVQQIMNPKILSNNTYIPMPPIQHPCFCFYLCFCLCLLIFAYVSLH